MYRSHLRCCQCFSTATVSTCTVWGNMDQKQGGPESGTADRVKDQPYNLIFLASAEEEVSGQGGVESVLPELPPIAFGVVGEPTAMHPAIAEKGLLVLDCVSHGRAGHAARNEGVNAISEAMKDIAWFHSYTFPCRSDLLGSVKMSVTMIEAGTQHNVVPDRCRFTVDVRTNEFYSNREALNEIRAHVSCDVTPRSLRFNSSRLDAGHRREIRRASCRERV